jgi:hypothetical protein
LFMDFDVVVSVVGRVVYGESPYELHACGSRVVPLARLVPCHVPAAGCEWACGLPVIRGDGD